MKKIYFVLTLVMMSFMARATSDTLAYYPLISDAVDHTGLNSDITLTNAPFSGGGVYCDGVSTDYLVQTPAILSFSFSNLSVSFDFKVDEYLTQSVIVCGASYRWLGCYGCRYRHIHKSDFGGRSGPLRRGEGQDYTGHDAGKIF